MTDNQNQPQNENAVRQNEMQEQPSAKAGATGQQKASISAMAVTGLVIGIVALLLSLVPIINNAAFFLAILGVVFAIIGIVGTGAGKKSGRGLAIAGLAVSIIAGIAVLGSQAFYSAAIDAAFDEPSETVVAEVVNEGSESSASDSSAASSASSDAAVAGDTYEQATESSYAVTIDGCKQTKDYNGKACVVITYTYTNNSDKAQAFYTTIADKAFQDGVELESAYLSGGDGSENSTKEIKPGKSIKVKQAFKLDSKTEPVTVEVSEIFSFSDALLAKKTFNLK